MNKWDKESKVFKYNETSNVYHVHISWTTWKNQDLNQKKRNKKWQEVGKKQEPTRLKREAEAAVSTLDLSYGEKG
jgi:anti-sigma factor ChrR (cupin superfamily)